MPSSYSLIQYLPDLARGERINIGVIVLAEGQSEVHFVENWNRVRQFGGNVSALQAVARQIEKMSADVLKETMASWQHSIQFTPPAASLLDADTLLIDIAGRCLIDPEQEKRDYRNRQEAIALTKQKLGAALKDAIGIAAPKLLKPHYSMDGRLDKHECDIAVVNGRPLLAANSISFETPEEKELVRVVHATAWTIDDIRQKSSDFPLAVIALPPKKALEVYDRAVYTFTKLGAEVVRENELTAWASQKAAHVNAALKGHKSGHANPSIGFR